MAMSEPVVLHHGRDGGGADRNEARPSASTACWAAGFCGLGARRSTNYKTVQYRRIGAPVRSEMSSL